MLVLQGYRGTGKCTQEGDKGGENYLPSRKEMFSRLGLIILEVI